MRTLHAMVLFLFLFATVGLYAQGVRNQETVDALQNQQIGQLEASSQTNTAAISALSRELAGLRSSLDRFTGIGIGLGAALTAIQSILVIVTVRNGRKG